MTTRTVQNPMGLFVRVHELNVPTWRYGGPTGGPIQTNGGLNNPGGSEFYSYANDSLCFVLSLWPLFMWSENYL